MSAAAYPGNSGKRRWVFPGGHVPAWLTWRHGFAETLLQTAATETATGRGSSAERWKAMTRN